MATSKPTYVVKQDAGYRLVDGLTLEDAAINLNAVSATYGITAAGTTQATATPLNSVLNEVDTTSGGTGVNLPLSTGKRATPFAFCIIYNNGANPLSVYGFQGSVDTINGVSGATAATIPAGGVALFNSAKPGSWFTGDVSGPGDFSGNITELLVGAGFVQKASATGAGRAGTFTLNGASTVTVTNTTVAITDTIPMSLNTQGGTIGVQPHIVFIQAGTSFGVIGTAADTSIYNYSMFGIN